MPSGESHKTQRGQSGIFRAALLGSCPQCGEPTLFEAPARVAVECSGCKLDFSKYERGGRVSGLFTVVIAIVLILVALGIENAFHPPLWLQAAVWAPVTVGTVIYSLRLFKTVLLYASFENAKDTAKDTAE